MTPLSLNININLHIILTFSNTANMFSYGLKQSTPQNTRKGNCNNREVKNECHTLHSRINLLLLAFPNLVSQPQMDCDSLITGSKLPKEIKSKKFCMQ
jgi:hypothetical protein